MKLPGTDCVLKKLLPLPLLPLLLLLLLLLLGATTADLLTRDELYMCKETDPLPLCQAKVTQCGPLTTSMLTPLLGTPQEIVTCANTTGTTLDEEYLQGLGEAMVTGSSKKLARKPTEDPTANLAMRKCVLSSAGLLDANSAVDRSAVGDLVSQLSPPSLGAAVTAAATTTCPLTPTDLNLQEYIECLVDACVGAVSPPTTTTATP